MPGVDWIPGVSQVKSLVQAATGDIDGALKTAENFGRECPVVSQVTSVIQLAAGDAEGALETQKKCLGTVNNVANGIPIVGHAKGLVHHAVGDHEGGNQALNAASRSTVVIGVGAVAAVTTGGIAAIPAGIAAGISYDVTATAVTGEEQGYIAAIKNVAENPSAGAVFDAVAIPVGDGLAGYSGGQMATKIQLNHLKAVREMKLDKMDAAANSGEALKCSAEIKSLTAKINTIEHGTPYFFDDPKTGTVASEATSSNAAVPPVPGYVDEEKNQRKRLVLGATISESSYSGGVIDVQQDDAVHYDSYVKVEAGNRQDAQKKLRERDEREPVENITGAFENTKMTTTEKLTDLLGSSGREPNRRPFYRKEVLDELLEWALLWLIMPEEFFYTVLTQLNSHFTGLYHSFIRHMDHWEQVLPDDIARLASRLDPLLADINRLVAATDEFESVEARKQFLEARRRLSPQARIDFQTAMVEMQMSMHRFMQRNMTFENYQGRSLNTKGQERLYFRVETASGPKAMVVCLSDRLFRPFAGSRRPIRTLITVFFETWKEFTSHGILEKKDEMKKRKPNK
ncbi:uncharacterized protein [Venturia canescens]|uniref:uncharacterized protein n=1 Tax=Venturia canescens TaxID=32260 RepID=UPI001C9CC9C5|nr:uncharacterized protein LOC122408184 [Venturia canescens]